MQYMIRISAFRLIKQGIFSWSCCQVCRSINNVSYVYDLKVRGQALVPWVTSVIIVVED